MGGGFPLYDLFKSSDKVASWPLLFCSIRALGIILERLYTLNRLKGLEDSAFEVLHLPGHPFIAALVIFYAEGNTAQFFSDKHRGAKTGKRIKNPVAALGKFL